MIGVKDKEKRGIWNFYRDQKVQIQIKTNVGDSKIQKGGRQDCRSSPVLFYIFIEKITEEMNERNQVRKIQGEFADDIATVEKSKKEPSGVFQAGKR